MQSVFPLTLTAADSFHGLTILLDAAIKGLAVLAVAAAATLALRRGSAALRHLVWSLSVLGLLCIPVLSVTLPQWRVPLLPSWAAVPAPVPVPAPAAAPQAPVETPSMSLPPVTVALSDPWQRPQGELPAGTAFPAKTGPLATAASTPASLPPSPHWSIWVLLGWAAGLLAMTVPLVVGTVGIRLSRRRAAPVTDPQWLSLLERLRRQLGVHRPIVLLRSSRSIIPLTCGLVRPVILLPAEADLWSQECRTMVLLHELAHIRRRDCLTQLLARLARVLYWFNPLVWLAGRMLRVERERACDDMVLAAGHKASAYAAHLLEIVSTLRSVRCPSLAAVAMARRSQFEGRMLAILDPRRNRRALTRLGLAVAALLVAGVVVPIAGIRATTADNPAATSGESAVPAEAKPAAADEVAWSEALNGLRVRLTAPSGTVYRRRAPLPLFVEVQNVGDKPIPFSRFSPQVRILATDAKGAWMGIPQRSPELSPWEGRTDSLAPGDIVHWTVWFDRLRFVKPVEQGSSLDLKVSAPTQLVEPGKLPKEVYSKPITIQIKDEFPSLPSETDLTGEWTAAMDLTFWEELGLRGYRAMHIDGQGRVTMLSRMGKNDDGLMPLGRTEAVLGKERLGRLAKLLRDQQIWRLAELKPDIGPDDAGEIRLSLANGGTSLVGDYPLHVAKDQPSLMALRTEMHALVADAVAAAQSETERKRREEEAAMRLAAEKDEDEHYRAVFEKYKAQILNAVKAGNTEEVAKVTDKFNESLAGKLLYMRVTRIDDYVRVATSDAPGKMTTLINKPFGDRRIGLPNLHYAFSPKPHVTRQTDDGRTYILIETNRLEGGKYADDVFITMAIDTRDPGAWPKGPPAGPAPAAPAAEVEPLPGSGTPLEKALAEGYAFVALCEAADEAALTDKVTGVHEYATCYQTLTVVEVLAGQKPADGVKGFHYTPFLWRGEHAVSKGQRVVWIVRQVEERFRGIKALEDTPENRKAIAEAAGVAIKPPVPPAAPPKESGAAPVTPKTVKEILDKLPGDQETLLKLAQSDKGEKGFYALLKLRQVGDAKAAAVLEKILADNFGRTRIHGFAAAQALFCIGTPEAHQVLARYLFTRDYHVPWGIKYAFSWKMKPVQRDAFIERYHLRSTGKELAVSLQAKPRQEDAQAETELTITLKNQTDKPLRVYEPDVYLGRMLLLRSPDGQFINSLESVDYNRRQRQGDEAYPLLGPGQERSYRIKASLRQDVPEAWKHLLPEGSGLALDCGDVWHFIGRPGTLKAYAVLYSAPLTKEQAELNKLNPEEVWSGYVVSAPVEIEIPAAAAGRAQGRPVEIRGRVLDPAGKPVPGAKVFVAGRGLVEFAPEHEPPIPTTETDAEGRFRLPAPAEGAKGIAVSTPALRAWSMALDGTGEEIALRLPEPGTLVLRYRMEGDDPEAGLGRPARSP